MPQYFKIGKFVSAHGLKGELVLKHSLGHETALEGLSALYLEDRNGSFLPYFPQAVRIKNEEELYITLEGVDVREKAIPLAQRPVWLPEEDFKRFTAPTAPATLLGYTVMEGTERIGIIEEVIEQPHQLLCRISMNGKEAYIPLHEETLLSVDRKGRTVSVELPPGLLEIYQ